MVTTAAPLARSRTRLTAAGLRASGVISAIGFVFLAAMFAAFAAGARSAGMTLGWINDVTGVVALPLAMPGMLAFHARLRPHAGRTGDILLVVGLGSAGTISVLQLLLVTGVLTFEDEIGPVSAAFLVLAVWFIATGRIAARHGVLPHGILLGVLAASYAGYPIWAFRLASALERHDAGPGAAAPSEPAASPIAS